MLGVNPAASSCGALKPVDDNRVRLRVSNKGVS